MFLINFLLSCHLSFSKWTIKVEHFKKVNLAEVKNFVVNKIWARYFQLPLKNTFYFSTDMGDSFFKGNGLWINRKRALPTENGWCFRTRLVVKWCMELIYLLLWTLFCFVPTSLLKELKQYYDIKNIIIHSFDQGIWYVFVFIFILTRPLEFYSLFHLSAWGK